MALDTQLHPEILTRLLQLAPRDTLLALRGTSTSVRDRADALLGYHMIEHYDFWQARRNGMPIAELQEIVRRGPPPTVMHWTTPEGRHPAFMPRESHWVLEDTTEVDQRDRIIKILRETRVLDRSQEGSQGVRPEKQIQDAALVKGKGPLRAYRNLPNSQGGYGLVNSERQCAAPTWVQVLAPYRRKDSQLLVEGSQPRCAESSEKAVYHFFHSAQPFAACWQPRSASDFGLFEPMVEDSFRQTVFVFSPADGWPIPSPNEREDMQPEDRHATDSSYSSRMRGWRRVDDLRQFMHDPLKNGVEVLVVGLERTPPTFLGYEPETSVEVMAGDIRANVMFDFIKRLALERFMGRVPEAGWEGDFETVTRLVSRLHFLTKAEYAARLTKSERYDEGVFTLPSGVRLDLLGTVTASDQGQDLPPVVNSASNDALDLALQPAGLTETSGTTAPISLDLDSYPHLFDRIVASSSAETLKTLSGTSHKLSEVVGRLFEHVWLIPSADQTTFTLRNRDGVLPSLDVDFPIRPRPDVDNLNDYSDGPLEHYGPWEDQAIAFPAMVWGEFAARTSLLHHTRVVDFPDPLLNHLGPLVLGLRGVEVARMSSGHMPGPVGILAARVQVVYTTPRTPLHDPQMATTPTGFRFMLGIQRLMLHVLFEHGQGHLGLPAIYNDRGMIGKGSRETVIAFSPFDERMHPPEAGPQMEDDGNAFSTSSRCQRLTEGIGKLLVSGFEWGWDRPTCSKPVTVVNVHLAAQWLGFSAADSESAANVHTSLWMRIHAVVQEDVRRFIRLIPMDSLSYDLRGRWTLDHVDEVTDVVMAHLSFESGEDYVSREDVHPAELDIELVPGARYQLLPRVAL